MILAPKTLLSEDESSKSFVDFRRLIVKVGTFSFGFDRSLVIDSSVGGTRGAASLSTLSRSDFGRKMRRNQVFLGVFAIYT